MSKVLSMFMLILCINIMIVLNGITLDKSVSLLSQISGVNDTTVAANLDANANTVFSQGVDAGAKDVLNIQGKNLLSNILNFFDPIQLIIGMLNIIFSVLFAPVVMAFNLGFPVWLTVMVCWPLTVAFWISGILLIRGVD